MKISIAMATYNGEKYIKKQLMSILSQTVKVDEIIIVDDCSCDSTVRIIKSIANCNPTIRLIVNEYNLGYTKNFKKALSYTTGDLVFLADQDDIWLPQKVEDILKAFQVKSCSAVCSQYELIDAEDNSITNTTEYRLSGERVRGKADIARITTLELIMKNSFPGCTCCITREVKDLLIKMNSDRMIHDHAALLIGSVCDGVYYMNHSTIRYRIHANNNIGISKKSRVVRIRLRKPQKPIIVEFLLELKKQRSIPFVYVYLFLCYLRIPYIFSMIKRIIRG